jgi:hypothetical protein
VAHGQNQKVNLIRYANDFIIIGRSKELLDTEVRPLVESFLARRGLQLSPEKTVITHINAGFNFLGQNSAVAVRDGAAAITAHVLTQKVETQGEDLLGGHAKAVEAISCG